ncbi:MAG: NAD-dependent epimerase/dehydratase family protein [Acidimicrobiales bacterium]
MRLLIVGGTSFVGRAISWSAWHQGHDVTVLNRGVTPNDLPETIERLVGDRHGDLSSLASRNFDATIDAIAYRPSDVERLANALEDRGGHYIQISSISAYEDPPADGATETAVTLWGDDKVDPEATITGETYGPLKAASERAGLRYFGDGATMVRPTYVIGSFDATLRFPYWVERVRRGGVVAVPGPRDNNMQYVDARDLANFVVRVADDGLGGAFHVAGPQPCDHFVNVVDQIASHVAPEGTTLREVSGEDVVALKLDEKFPLWSGAKSETVLALNSALALANGLDFRPLTDSVDDVSSWWGDRAWPTHWLTSTDEVQLLDR